MERSQFIQVAGSLGYDYEEDGSEGSRRMLFINEGGVITARQMPQDKYLLSYVSLEGRVESGKTCPQCIEGFFETRVENPERGYSELPIYSSEISKRVLDEALVFLLTEFSLKDLRSKSC